MGKVLGFMLFFIGLGMVIGLLVSETVALLIAAALCLMCGYHLFCENKTGVEGNEILSAPVFLLLFL